MRQLLNRLAEGLLPLGVDRDEVGVLGVAGMARFSAAGPTGLRRDHCRDRPWQVVIARPGRENMQRHHTQETREANPQDQESPVQQVCGT